MTDKQLSEIRSRLAECGRDPMDADVYRADVSALIAALDGAEPANESPPLHFRYYGRMGCDAKLDNYYEATSIPAHVTCPACRTYVKEWSKSKDGAALKYLADLGTSVPNNAERILRNVFSMGLVEVQTSIIQDKPGCYTQTYGLSPLGIRFLRGDCDRNGKSLLAQAWRIYVETGHAPDLELQVCKKDWMRDQLLMSEMSGAFLGWTDAQRPAWCRQEARWVPIFPFGVIENMPCSLFATPNIKRLVILEHIPSLACVEVAPGIAMERVGHTAIRRNEAGTWKDFDREQAMEVARGAGLTVLRCTKCDRHAIEPPDVPLGPAERSCPYRDCGTMVATLAKNAEPECRCQSPAAHEPGCAWKRWNEARR